jgi:EpsI family protein
MEKRSRELRFSRSAVILSALLLTQTAVFYGFSRNEHTPIYRPLDDFPVTLGSWHMFEQGIMEPEIKEVLRADDYITRTYFDSNTRKQANLFVAFFKTQRGGQAPHSPKNCLPGAGWVWTVSDVIPIDITGRSQPIQVNRYVVEKGGSKSLVLYWYQSRERVVASEYTAKVYVVADAIRYNRTDTSLVRVVVPVTGDDTKGATKAGTDFVQAFFNPLKTFLPQ